MSTRAVRMPMQAAMRAILRHRAHLQPEAGSREHDPDEQQHQADEDHDRHAVVGEHDALHERVAADSHDGAADRHVLRAEDQTHRLDQAEAHAPGREQRLERPAVEKAEHPALDAHADQRAHRRRRAGRATTTYQSKYVGRVTLEADVHHVGHVGAEHQHLAVGHVDHAHQAERDREAQRGQQEHAAQAQAVHQVAHDASRALVGTTGRQHLCGGGAHLGVGLDVRRPCRSSRSVARAAA